MKRIYFIIPAVLLAACIVLIALYGAPAITWKEKAGQMYLLDMNSKIRMYYEGSPAEITSSLQAVLNFRITGISDNGINTDMQLSDIMFTHNDRRNKAYEQVLAAPFRVRFAENGGILGYSFKGMAKGDDKFFRGIAASLVCVVKKSFFDRWSNTENDEYGTYSASYSSSSSGTVIRKKKDRYTESEHNILSYTGRSEISLVKSNARFAFSKDNSWIKNMDSFEFVRFHADGKKIMELEKRVDLSLTDFNPDTSLAIWNANASRSYEASDDNWTDECAECRDREYSYEYMMEQEAMKEFIKDESIDGLLAKIIRADGNDPKLTKKLKIFLTLYPESVKGIYDDTLKGRYNTSVLSVIMQAMAETGHEQAQDYLRNTATEAEAGKTVNLMSTVNMGFLQNPSAETLETLKELYGMRDGDMNTMISNSAILAMGRLAAGMKGREGSDNVAGEMGEFIAGELQSNSKDPNIAASCIGALGSIGDEEYFDTVESYLEHESGFVRASAITALTNFRDDSVPEMLRDHFASENDESARKKVIEGLAAYPPEQESIDLIKKNLVNEKSQSVRNVMLRYLVGSRDHDPGIKEMLKKALSTETSTTNRDIIFSGLYSKKNKPK